MWELSTPSLEEHEGLGKANLCREGFPFEWQQMALFCSGIIPTKVLFFQEVHPSGPREPKANAGIYPQSSGGAGGDSPPVLPRALLVAAIRAGLQNVIRLSGSSWNVPTAAHRTGSCSPNPSFLPPSSQALSAEHELPC